MPGIAGTNRNATGPSKRRMMMKALDAFDLTHQRALALIDIHRKLHSRGKPPKKSADILRSAVVLAVAGMDAYFTDKISENAVPLIRKLGGKDLPGKLVDAVSNQMNSQQMLEAMLRQKPLAHVGTAVRKALANNTYQDPGKIEQGLRMLGVSNFWCEVAAELGMAQTDVRSSLARVVKRRHDIVHKGDLGTTKKTKHKLRALGRTEAEEMVQTIDRFVRAADEVINKQIRG